MKPLRFRAAASLVLMLVSAVQAADSVDQRSAVIPTRQVEKTFPDPRGPATVELGNRCIQGKLGVALSALYLNRSARERDAANAAIQDACARIPKDPGNKGYMDPRNKASARVDRAYDLYFVSGLLLSMIYEMFGQASRTYPGRITLETEQAISDGKSALVTRLGINRADCWASATTSFG
jgi:hypothetical protein